MRELSGAPGRPEEEGRPVWKTSCPRGAHRRVLPAQRLAPASPSCPAGPLPARPLSQLGDRLGSGLSRCFSVSRLRQSPLLRVSSVSHAERTPAPPPDRGGARTHTHTATCGRSQVPASSEQGWAPGPAPTSEVSDQQWTGWVQGRSRTPPEAGSCDFGAVPGGARHPGWGAESTSRGRRSSGSSLSPTLLKGAPCPPLCPRCVKAWKRLPGDRNSCSGCPAL